MEAILIHGMGRTPAAMSILAARLSVAGIRPHLFGYSVTFERWDNVIQRYKKFIEKSVGTGTYIIVGHSLGTVITRAALPKLKHKPGHVFFLAPPSHVCLAARTFAHQPFIRQFMGEIGKVLVNEPFMESLPLPEMPAKIYCGTAGPRGRYSPFGEEPNDGLLTIKETILPGVQIQEVHALHTFIMNSKLVTEDIVKIAKLIPME